MARGTLMSKSELESKILSCHGKMSAASIAKLLDIKVAKVYRVFNKFDIVVKPPYGIGKPKKRSVSVKRICKPYKNSQL